LCARPIDGAALARPQARGVLPADLHHAGRGTRVLARKRVEQLLLSVARDARDAHDLARAHFQVDVVQVHAELVHARQAERLRAQHRGARAGFAVRQRRRLGADHQARERSVGLLARVAHARHAARTHHRAGGAQGPDLVQLVADVEDAAALAGELAQHHEELFHRLGREHRGGLVQDQQLRVGQQRADDLHALHLAHAQGVDGARRVHVQPVLRSRGGDAARHLGQLQALVQAQPHVLGHRERVEQAEVLEHHGDAERARLLRVAHLHRLAVEVHVALVGLDGAVDDLHQRGLAGAVLAQHRMHLAGLHGERDAVVGHHGRVSLGDARQLQPRRRAGSGRRCGVHACDCLLNPW
jgi:hypothetical protein